MHHLPKQSILFRGSIQARRIHICWGCVHVGLGDNWSVLGNHCTYDRRCQARLPQRVDCGYSIRCGELGVQEWANLEVQVNSCYAYPRQAMQPSRIRALLHNLWRRVGTCLGTYWTMPDIAFNFYSYDFQSNFQSNDVNTQYITHNSHSNNFHAQ